MKKKRILVLGAGLIGKPIALDLIKDNAFSVDIADISTSVLNSFHETGIVTHLADLKDKSKLISLIDKFDYFINAVPGFMGYEVLRTIIEAGKPIVDIAFYPEDPLTLNALALKHNVCVICDMGVAPGMSHLLSGYAAAQLEKVEKILIFVGGLPKKRSYPWEYKAVFSPSDVIEEYTRPARLVENGQIVFKEALSEQEFLEFDDIGTLEAFNSDGLRSLIYTMKADYMAEKTLRYPGHVDKINVLKSSGFFDEEYLDIDGTLISPLVFTKKVLFPKWKLGEGEEDFTVMRILVEGINSEGKRKLHTFDLYDRYDASTRTHSMARTTGYAATSALRLIESGLFNKPGIHVPEMIGKNEKAVHFMLDSQLERGIQYKMSVKDI